MNQSTDNRKPPADETRTLNRRRWLQGCTRYAILGGLTAGTALLVLRRPGKPTRQDCIRTIACRDCRLLGDCNLPRARRAKRETEG